LAAALEARLGQGILPLVADGHSELPDTSNFGKVVFFFPVVLIFPDVRSFVRLAPQYFFFFF
jgi:hypothetical protein